MTIGEKIKSLRKSFQMTQTELGAKLGVQKNAVSKWECGRVDDIPSSKIKAMAQLFGVEPSYLIDDDKEFAGTGASRPPLPADADPIDFSKLHRIPILGQIAAGLPIYAEENIEGYTYTDLNGGAEYFALRVRGDSMTAARINEGDILIVRRQDTVEDGEIAVVLVNNEEATVKRFYQTGSTVTLMPQSTNPSHTPQVYDLTQTEIRILGKVVKIEIVI